MKKNISTEALKLMAAKGLSTADIIEIMEALGGRSKAAERQARYRKKKSGGDVTGDVTNNVTGDATRDADSYVTRTPYEDTSIPITPVEAKASPAPGRGRANRGMKIPVDWKLPPIADLPDEARALASKWPAAAYRAEGEAFKNFWLAETKANARKSDWDRAWANRIVAVNGKVMRDAKFGNGPTDETTPTAKPAYSPERQAEWDAISAEYERLKAAPYDRDAKEAWLARRDRFLAAVEKPQTNGMAKAPVQVGSMVERLRHVAEEAGAPH